ncbi:hypothetical protein DPMN_121827 [Dreissena polymorpha]|uniref:Uncharacterized protein n=1 Tax=Dreissena polymorpha TaxID=45954 RepID=A0A9D4JTI3_DREPO|nr:hypothetical protein DPMN_121827 [Dreissena polymorpha]
MCEPTRWLLQYCCSSSCVRMWGDLHCWSTLVVRSKIVRTGLYHLLRFGCQLRMWQRILCLQIGDYNGQGWKM